VFNTLLLELTLLGKKKIKVIDAVLEKELPQSFSKIKFKRDYYKCVLVDFIFRGIPQRVTQQQHFAFGGLADVTFKAYVLNDDELKLLQQELDKSDIHDSFALVEGITDESLKELQQDIDYFLNEKNAEEEEKEKKKSNNINPFSALFGIGEKKEKNKEKSQGKDSNKKEMKIENIKKESYVEKHIREFAEEKAKEDCDSVFNTYKKAHGMVTP
jgi:hypothetical protein